MNWKLLILTLLITKFTLASESKRIAPQFYKSNSEIISPFNENQSTYRFELYRLPQEDAQLQILYSIDGLEYEVTLDSFAFEVPSTPGKHIFQIYLNQNYYEIYSDSLEIAPGTKDTYLVRVDLALQEIMVDKPVIYLYPEEAAAFNVQVIPTGEMQFTYPVLNEAWKGIAHPNGDLDMNGETFSYLFWEAKQVFAPIDPNTSEGFVVSTDSLLSFLESTLSHTGFRAKERADFITYWVPKMLKYESVFITFHQQEACEQFGTLNITPQPDNINRFYMSWADYTGGAIPLPQEIEPMDRTGFDVLEWGGQQIPLNTKENLQP